MEVLVFSTSVESRDHVDVLAPLLNSVVGDGRWNFALDDCDRILRIVSADVKPGVDPATVAARVDAITAQFLADGPTLDEVPAVSKILVRQ